MITKEGRLYNEGKLKLSEDEDQPDLWYMGLIKEPSRGEGKDERFNQNVREFLDYEGEIRPRWEPEIIRLGLINNQNKPCEFKIIQNSILVGVFITSEPQKGNLDGLIYAEIPFRHGKTKNVYIGDTLNVFYDLDIA